MSTRKPLITRAHVETRLTREIVQRYCTHVKNDWGWSARKIAAYIGYSRGHLKGVVGGSKQISPHFERAFRKIQDAYAYWMRDQNDVPSPVGVVTVVSKQPLPARIYITHPVVKCRSCGIHFMQVNSRQRKCSPECIPLTKRTRRRARKENDNASLESKPKTKTRQRNQRARKRRVSPASLT